MAVLAAAGVAAPAALGQGAFEAEHRFGGQEQGYQQPYHQQQTQQGDVVVGYDLDRDGLTDAWYKVSREDFQRMLNENRQSLTSGQTQPERLFGQQGQRFTQQDPWQQQPRMGQQHRGEVTSVRTFHIPEDGKEHLLARVDLESGRRIVVDLGPEENLRNVRIDEGEMITFTGTPSRINNRPVIAANELRAGGRTVQIHTAMDRGAAGVWGMQDMQGMQQGQNLRQVRGEIQSTRTTRIDGAPEPHTLARLELDDGRTVVIDLGPEQDLQQLNLEEGDEIEALVQPAMINNRTVFKAHELSTDNRTVRVRQSMMMPQGQQDPQMRQRLEQQRRQRQMRQNDPWGQREDY